MGTYLGEFTSAEACAPAAATEGCTMFMFAATYTMWGCSCCLAKTDYHQYWNIYSLAPVSQPPPLSASPPPSSLPPSPPASIPLGGVQVIRGDAKGSVGGFVKCLRPGVDDLTTTANFGRKTIAAQ